MDEFCANKDSQLKRCACSARVSEFDGIQNQLDQIEDKLLDFNQRLLTVNMDKEDAMAISQATEGEIAFLQEDTSASKELLDEISEKLNTTFDTSSFDANLAPISLSLNRDAAFDSVDSLAGASTTSLTGTSLYSAALPVCREMAMEVCTADELDIVESGYQMAIEQDCNTVAKAYQTQQDLAREKIREGGALLDMSRLNTYQERNSDDLLTCKKKMLDLLTNTAVCGNDLGKCLDISGQYIDPSTGEAILTPNLVNLSTLITRPTGDQTWTNAPGNDRFVKYLESKRMFLESATENCEEIADSVWDGFLEDALAQIKLAQDAKMEAVRQSCTTLTAQCLTDAADSLEDFDARALSIFGVAADKTAKQMCAQVQSACVAILDTVDGGMEWGTGMTEIAADKTFDTILQTCREVGRNCIIQSCKSIAGNFGLCDDIDTSVNRKAIINRTACWGEVLNCVADAGDDTIEQITTLLMRDGTMSEDGTFYHYLYGQDLSNAILKGQCIDTVSDDGNTKITPYCIHDVCASECGTYSDGKYSNQNSAACRRCRLAERIWGNCESAPNTVLSDINAHNKIHKPITNASGDDTLLAWFAKNTNTQDAIDSCRDTTCGPGYIATYDPDTGAAYCISESELSDDGETCPLDSYWRFYVNGDPDTGYTNCCKAGRDSFVNCCMGNLHTQIRGFKYDVTEPYYIAAGTKLPTESKIPAAPFDDKDGTIPDDKNGGLCLPERLQFVAAIPMDADGSELGFLFCTNDSTTGASTPPGSPVYPSGDIIDCANGRYVIVTKSGKYATPGYENPEFADKKDDPDNAYPQNSYNLASGGGTCRMAPNGKWFLSDKTTECAEPKNYKVNYNTQLTGDITTGGN